MRYFSEKKIVVLYTNQYRNIKKVIQFTKKSSRFYNLIFRDYQITILYDSIKSIYIRFQIIIYSLIWAIKQYCNNARKERVYDTSGTIA